MKTVLRLIFFALCSPLAHANLVACETLAQQVGYDYLAKPNLIASRVENLILPDKSRPRFKAKVGQWFIYQTPTDWFKREACGIQTLEHNTDRIHPVLWNQHTKRYGVINGQVLIEWLKGGLTNEKNALIKRLGLNEKVFFGNGKKAIYQSPTATASLDDLAEALKSHIAIKEFQFLIDENRYRLR